MGLFDKLSKGFSNMVGGVDSEVLQIGVPAQAEILQVQMTGTSVQMGGGLTEQVCLFVVKVTMNDTPQYQVQVRQRLPEIYLSRFQQGASMVVAAKVHPQDPNRVVLDFNAPPPPVRMAPAADPTHSAAYVLSNGQPGEAVIVGAQPLNVTNSDGVPVHALQLTVIPQDGRPPYQIQVGNPVPPNGLPLVFPGSRLPVRMLPQSPNAVVIDWAKALGG